MDAYLLEVYCPANDKRYEFWLSKRMLILEATMRIAEEIKAFEQNNALFSLDHHTPNLYCREQQSLLAPQLTLQQARIESGLTLLII